MFGTAPRRPYIPIIVYAGENLKAYLAWGMAAVAVMVLLCPVCGTRLVGNGWRERVAKERSKGYEEQAPTMRVHQLVCPLCRVEGRHPWNFRVLPSFTAPFKHFVQQVRLAVFHLSWDEQRKALAVEVATGVERWLVRRWLAKANDVLADALAGLGAAITAPYVPQ